MMATGDIDDPIDYGGIVRNNLMKRQGYAPYCGHVHCFNRLVWDGEQFECKAHKYRTDFPEDFIAGYKARWHEGATHD